MKYKPYPAVTKSTSDAMFTQWLNLIKLQESGTFLWPPLNAPYRRIWQLQKDQQIRKSVLGPAYSKYIFIHVDLGQIDSLTTEQLHQIMIESISAEVHYQNTNPPSLNILIDQLQSDNRITTLLVTGIDASIKKNNWLAVNELNIIANRNWQTQVLLFAETDLTHPDYWNSFSQRTTLAQNITVVPLYTRPDQEIFIKFLCANWDMSITPNQRTVILSESGGHFLLIKDAIRQIRLQPHLKPKDIFKLPSLVLRAQAIVNNLHPDEKQVLRLALTNQAIPAQLSHSLEYLTKQGWLLHQNGSLKMTVSYLEKYITQLNDARPTDNVWLQLSPQEQKVYEYLQNHPSQLINRETVAQVQWDEAWQDHYSDWAIDKLMSRLRKKLQETNTPFKLLTKKGQGFILVSK